MHGGKKQGLHVNLEDQLTEKTLSPVEHIGTAAFMGIHPRVIHMIQGIDEFKIVVVIPEGDALIRGILLRKE